MHSRKQTRPRPMKHRKVWIRKRMIWIKQIKIWKMPKQRMPKSRKSWMKQRKMNLLLRRTRRMHRTRLIRQNPM